MMSLLTTWTRDTLDSFSYILTEESLVGLMVLIGALKAGLTRAGVKNMKERINENRRDL